MDEIKCACGSIMQLAEVINDLLDERSRDMLSPIRKAVWIGFKCPACGLEIGGVLTE